MREMVAKYPGRCTKCGKAINVGESIFWQKEQGKRGAAWHKLCDGAKSNTPPEREREQSAPPETTPDTPPERPSVKIPHVPLIEPEPLDHPLFPTLLAMTQAGVHVYVHGAPGAGKSHAAEAIAERVERPYRYVSLSPQSMPSLLFGYMDAQGRYVRTGFRDVVEYGGVICIDEVDNANANLLASMNSALANRLVEFPDAQVPMHSDCIVIATGNTPGNGPTLAFPERRPLDRAFRDRFAFLEWTYAPEHERSIARSIVGEGLEALADAWSDWLHAVRTYCASHYPALTCSPRTIYAGLPLLSRLPVALVADATLFQGIKDETVRAKILTACPLPSITWAEA